MTDDGEVAAFVAAHGLEYERWPIERLEADRAQNDTSDESDEERVLRVFEAEIERLKERGAYATADVVALTPQTPKLDELLAKFDREHIHTEDEVRFVVDGRGIFTIHAEDGTVFDVEVHPGDLLVVPAKTKHWFTLCDDRTIQCVRLFQETEGWTPHYTGAETPSS